VNRKSQFCRPSYLWDSVSNPSAQSTSLSTLGVCCVSYGVFTGFLWIGLNKRSRLTHLRARGRGNTLCLCCIGSAATGVVSSISLMVSFPIEIRPCTPDSEPPLPTPHASTTLVQDAASGTSSCKRVANGSAIKSMFRGRGRGKRAKRLVK
jgi:hypothetical protein